MVVYIRNLGLEIREFVFFVCMIILIKVFGSFLINLCEMVICGYGNWIIVYKSDIFFVFFKKMILIMLVKIGF